MGSRGAAACRASHVGGRHGLVATRQRKLQRLARRWAVRFKCVLLRATVRAQRLWASRSVVSGLDRLAAPPSVAGLLSAKQGSCARALVAAHSERNARRRAP